MTSSPADVGGRYDVFVSYNRRDAALAEAIASRLQRARLKPWFDRWCVSPGGNWQSELAAGLAASGSCAVLVGPNDLGSWEQQELGVALVRAAKDPTFRVFLVLLPGLPEPFDPTALSPFLSTRTWVDFRGGWDSDHAFQPLVNAIKGVPLGPPQARSEADGAAPYRGLQTFDEEHAEDFFGRDADVQRLLEKLKAGRFIAVVGASGSGKSSLVRAGVVPALRAGALPASEAWTVQLLLPGPRPLVTLAARVLDLAAGGAMQDTVSRLGSDPRSLDMAVSGALVNRGGADRVLWVVDQAEELFTLCRDERDRQRFLENLLYASHVPGGRNLVLLTVRGDFYASFGRFQSVAQALAAHQVLVGPMDLDGLRQAIEEPARRAGVHFEDGLVETILQDVARQPGALPLLEEALLGLWQRRRGRLLTLEAYQEAGRVDGAIAQRAEAVLGSLAPRQVEVARRVLLRLTEPGEGTEDTRRRAPRSELESDSSDSEAVDEVISALVEARMVVTSADPVTREPSVEVSHEALIRGWPRLRRWIDDDRAGLRIHRRLTEAADEWERLSRDEGELYRGMRLAEATDWLTRHPAAANVSERAFVAAGVALRDRTSKRRRRRFAVLAAALLVGLVISCGAALIAVRQRDAAERQQALAQSRAIASVAVDQLRVDPQLALLLAVEAAEKALTDEAADALGRALLEPQPRLTIRAAAAVDEAHFSPNQRTILTAGDSGVRLWDARTGRLRRVLGGSHLGAYSAAFSPSGRAIVTADGQTAAIWTAAGKLVARQRPRGAGSSSAITNAPFSPSNAPFSPDERLVVLVPTFASGSTSAGGPFVVVWNPATDRRRVLRAQGHEVADVADARFSPDGRYVSASTSETTSEVWDVASRQTVAKMEGSVPHFSPDGDRLLTFADGRALLWALPSGRRVADLDAASATAAFDRDGRLIATASSRGINVSSAANGERADIPLKGVRPVGEPALSPNGRFYIAPGSPLLRSAVTGERIAQYPASAAFGYTEPFSSDSRSILTADDNGVHAWAAPRWDATKLGAALGEVVDLATGAQSWTAVTASGRDMAQVWRGPIAPTAPGARRVSPILHAVTGIGISDDGRFTASVRRDGRLDVWQISPWRRIATVAIEAQEPHRTSFPVERIPVAISNTGRLVAIMNDLTTVVWDTAKGRRLASRSEDGGGTGDRVILSATGRLVASVGSGGSTGTKVWDSRTGRVVAVLRSRTGNLAPAAFNRDGTQLVTISDDGNTALWQARSGRRIAVIRGAGDSYITSAALSADGRFLANSDWDGPLRTTLRIWEAKTGRAIAELPVRAANAIVAFSPIDRTIVAAGSGVVHKVECDVCRSPNALLKLAKTRARRSLTTQERREFLHER